MDKYVVVYITCSSKDEAEELSRRVVTERLAASINVLHGVQSFFNRDDAVDRQQQSLMIVKTKRALLKNLTGFVLTNHSSDVPEIIADRAFPPERTSSAPPARRAPRRKTS